MEAGKRDGESSEEKETEGRVVGAERLAEAALPFFFFFQGSLPGRHLRLAEGFVLFLGCQGLFFLMCCCGKVRKVKLEGTLQNPGNAKRSFVRAGWLFSVENLGDPTLKLNMD